MNDGDRYLIGKPGRKTWQYRRRVPKEVKHLDGRAPIVLKSTGQRHQLRARWARDSFEAADDLQWSALMAGEDAHTARERYDAAMALNAAAGFLRPRGEQLLGEIIQRNLWAFEIIGDQSINKEVATVDVPYTNAATGEVMWVEEEQEVPVFDDTVHNALLGRVPKPEMSARESFEFWRDELAHNEWNGKSPDQFRRWQNIRLHAIAVYEEVLGAGKGFIKTSRADAQDIHRFLNQRVLRGELKGLSARKDLSFLRKLWRLLAQYEGIDENNPFRDLNWSSEYEPRIPFSADWLRDKFLHGDGLSTMGKELRRAILVMIETGCRPAEIINLEPEHIVLDHEIPHIKIAGTIARQQKTKSSLRDIPLMGVALAAMQKQPAGFLSYKDKGSQFSAAANKYIKTHGLRETPEHKLYSIRHCFEDRLKDAEIGDDLRRALMGHTVKDRPTYGRGFNLKAKRDALEGITLPFDPLVI